MQGAIHGGGDRKPTLLYLRHQVVNLDRIAEISAKRGRVTLCYAFARLGDPGARLLLSPAEAEALLAALRDARGQLPAWVSVGDRLVNLDLALDVWATADQVTLVPALPDQRGGALPRRFPRPVAEPLLAYFRRADVLPMDHPASSADRPGWVVAGEHLINLALVSNIRFSAEEVQLSFAGLPHFARSIPYAEARLLLDRLQQLGGLPIDALRVSSVGQPGGSPDTEDGETLPVPTAGRRRRLGGWMGRRR